VVVLGGEKAKSVVQQKFLRGGGGEGGGDVSCHKTKY